MRLIYVCQDGASPSGVASYGYQVLRHVAGARMLLLNTSTVPVTAPPDVAGRVSTLPEASSHQPAAIAAALRRHLARDGAPSVVLPNTGDTPWAAALELLSNASARERAGLRVLGMVHSDTDTQYALADRYRTLAPSWIAVSHRCAERLRSLRVVVHHLPYPMPVLPTSRVLSAGRPLRLAYVARLEEPQKRVSRLVPLFVALRSLGVDFQATIAGDGPAAGTLRAEIDRCPADVSGRVEMTGAIGPARVEELWRTHDVCLLVSDHEGLPLSLLEAMAAAACPVVMAVDSGLPDVLVHGHNARCVPQGDVLAMAHAIAELAASREEVLRLGLAAQRTIASRHDPTPHFARLREICAEVVRQPAPELSQGPPDAVAAAALALAAELEPGEEVAVFGAGMFGRKVVDACLARGALVRAVFDSDPARTGRTYRGIACSLPAGLAAHRGTVVVGSLHFAGEIAEHVERVAAEAGTRFRIVVRR